MKVSLFLSVALAFQGSSQAGVAANKELPRLSVESQAHLRCAAAFALVSYGQANGNESALQWPDLDGRGREFFVRTMARIMEETGIDRDGAAQLAQSEAQHLLDEDEVERMMPACLAMLEASGL